MEVEAALQVEAVRVKGLLQKGNLGEDGTDSFVYFGF